MRITHFGGTVDCTTIDELKNILNTRYGENSNNFWIARNEKYPLLTILVKDEYANLTFFPGEDSSGFLSIGNELDLAKDDFTDFYVNTPTEIISVKNNFVIPFTTALKIAEEFFITLSKPSCIDWFEL